MLTNQDRRAILDQVKNSENGDIIASLRGNAMPVTPQTEQPQQQAQPQPVNIPEQTPQSVSNVSMQTPETGSNSLVNSFDNSAPQIQDLPTGSAEPQILKKGGFEKQFNTNYKESQNYQRIKNSRKGSRYNPPPEETALTDEGSHSTHLMADDKKNTAWPTLFQNKDGSWFELSKIDAYKEATRRDEIYKFDSKEEMINFARKGDWKDTYQKGGYVQKYPHGGPHDYIPAEASSTSVYRPPNNLQIEEEEAQTDQFGSTSGSLYPSEPKPSTFDKIINVGANPLAAFGRSVRGEDVNPGYIGRGENNFDAFALGMVNPASWVESGQYAASDFKDGNYMSGALNTLGALPVVPAALKGVKNIKTARNINIHKKGVAKTKETKRLLEEKTTNDKLNIENRDYTPSKKELAKIEDIKQKNIDYIKSQEYINKRSANTGESVENIKAQTNSYITELNNTPINFKPQKFFGGPEVGGSYMHRLTPFDKAGQINISNPSVTNNFKLSQTPLGKQGFMGGLNPTKYSGIDHEVKHLLSPSGKFDEASAMYKLSQKPNFQRGLKKYKSQMEDINNRFLKADNAEDADRILGEYSKIPDKELFDGTMKFNKVNKYDNYPTVKVPKQGSADELEHIKYLNSPQEQQVRFLKINEHLKTNYGWDGTEKGLTNDMMKNFRKQTELGSKSNIDADVRDLTSRINFADLKKALPKAWAVAPVGLGAATQTNTKEKGGFSQYDKNQEKLEIDYGYGTKKKATSGKETSYRQHMMNFLHDTNKVDTNYVNNIMQVIAEHESGNVTDKIQVSGDRETGFYDGPARGAYQYETGIKQGGSTAMNRNASFTRDSTNRSFINFPTLYNEGLKTSPDFSTFSREDQDGLFLGDKMNKNKSSSKQFYDLVKNDGTPPTSDETFEFWGRNHKRVFSYTVGEKTVKYTYDELPADKKKLERKKWNSRTKNKFKTGS